MKSLFVVIFTFIGVCSAGYADTPKSSDAIAQLVREWNRHDLLVDSVRGAHAMWPMLPTDVFVRGFLKVPNVEKVKSPKIEYVPPYGLALKGDGSFFTFDPKLRIVQTKNKAYDLSKMSFAELVKNLSREIRTNSAVNFWRFVPAAHAGAEELIDSAIWTAKNCGWEVTESETPLSCLMLPVQVVIGVPLVAIAEAGMLGVTAVAGGTLAYRHLSDQVKDLMPMSCVKRIEKFAEHRPSAPSAKLVAAVSCDPTSSLVMGSRNTEKTEWLKVQKKSKSEVCTSPVQGSAEPVCYTYKRGKKPELVSVAVAGSVYAAKSKALKDLQNFRSYEMKWYEVSEAVGQLDHLQFCEDCGSYLKAMNGAVKARPSTAK